MLLFQLALTLIQRRNTRTKLIKFNIWTTAARFPFWTWRPQRSDAQTVGRDTILQYYVVICNSMQSFKLALTLVRRKSVYPLYVRRNARTKLIRSNCSTCVWATVARYCTILCSFAFQCSHSTVEPKFEQPLPDVLRHFQSPKLQDNGIYFAIFLAYQVKEAIQICPNTV